MSNTSDGVFERIVAVLKKVDDPHPPIWRSFLYSEQWMIRIVLDWASSTPCAEPTLQFQLGSRWRNGGSLPSPYSGRFEKEPLLKFDSVMNGYIGHFDVIPNSQGLTVCIRPDGQQFHMIRGLIHQSLTYRHDLSKWWDLASGAVSALAESFRLADADPTAHSDLRYTVIAPTFQIKDDESLKCLDAESIRSRVRSYVDRYEGELDGWYDRWFTPTLDSVTLSLVSWEHLLDVIRDVDADAGEQLAWFYGRCVEVYGD